jgi:hypothetical protein
VKAERGWKRQFEDPIALPDGRTLITLEDAGAYITKLPEAVHTAAEWQAAMEALILVATLGGPGIMAQTPPGGCHDPGRLKGRRCRCDQPATVERGGHAVCLKHDRAVWTEYFDATA